MSLLAIFDNDGTICDTQDVEGACYARAIEHVTGRLLSTLDWTTYEEPTSSAIIRDLLADDPDAYAKEEKIKREFVRLLEQERPRFPGDFMPLPGAVQFIARLKEETGFEATDWSLLGVMHANPARQTNRIHCYLARGLSGSGIQTLDISEEIVFEFKSIGEIKAMIQSGEFGQALHIASFLLATERVEKTSCPNS